MSVSNITDFCASENLFEDDFIQNLNHVGGVDRGVFDLFFDILFLIGQILIKISVSLNIRLAFQFIQGFLNPSSPFLGILRKIRSQQNGNISCCRLEWTYIFHQEQSFEYLHCKRIAQVLLCRGNCSHCVAFHRLPDSLVHQVEGGKTAKFLLSKINDDSLEHPQHGTFADGIMLSLKHIVFRKTLNCGLEQRKLIRDKRITGGKISEIVKLPVSL